MRLPRAYRSLARPSSVLEPSHPPDGTATPKQYALKTIGFELASLPLRALAHPSALASFRFFGHCDIYHRSLFANSKVTGTLACSPLQSNSASKDTHIHSIIYKTNPATLTCEVEYTTRPHGRIAYCRIVRLASTPSPPTLRE